MQEFLDGYTKLFDRAIEILNINIFYGLSFMDIGIGLLLVTLISYVVFKLYE